MTAWNKIPFDREELKKLYTDQRLSMAKIGNIYNCDTGVIHRNLREFGIKIRKLSEATTKIHTTKKQLTKWYWQEKLSMFEIAKKLGCTHSAIVYKFQKMNIKSRGRLGLTKPIKLSQASLKYLYSKRNLSIAKIAKIIHKSKGGVEKKFNQYKILSRGMSNRTSKYKKKNFSNNLMEKAYMMGFRLGDLNVYELTNVIQVRCSSTHRAQIKLIRDLFAPYTTPHSWKAKRGTTEIVCLLNKSFKFLVPKIDEVPSCALNGDNLFWSFFAGYADAEGSFTFKKPKKNGKTRAGYFSIQSQDKNTIIGLASKLESLGIECYGPLISRRAGSIDKRGIRNNRDMWKFDVIKKISLWKMINKLSYYIRHSEKVLRLRKIKENIMYRNMIPYARPISLET